MSATSLSAPSSGAAGARADGARPVPGRALLAQLRALSGASLQKLALTACAAALLVGLATRCWRFHQQSEQLGARLFALYDQNRDALLNSGELVKYLSDHGVNISSRQASSWLAVVDDEADGFDIGETKTVLGIFDELPTASAALQHVAQDASVLWDFALFVPLGAILTFLIWHPFGATPNRQTPGSITAEALQVSPSADMQNRKKQLSPKMSPKNDAPVPRLPSKLSPPLRSPTAPSLKPRGMITCSTEEAQPLEPASESAEPVVDLQREVRRWRSAAERHMGEASAVTMRLASLKSCLRGADALRGSARGLFTDEGACEGFCAKGLENGVLAFGTLDLNELFEVDLSGTLEEACDSMQVCRNVITGQHFSVKIYDLTRHCGTSRREMEILNELHAQRWLPAHERIARHVSVVETEEHLFVVFELVHGDDLVSAIDDRGFSLTEEEARRIFVQVSQALVALHADSVRVIHGSMKPDNIVVEGGATRLHREDVSIRLVDFSRSSFLCADEPGEIVGDDYLAPEDLHEDARQSMATDIWRFGAALYAALLGRLPFTHDVLVDGKWRPAVDADRLEKGRFHEPAGV